MGFGEGFSEGFGKGITAPKSIDSSKTSGNSLGSEIRKGAAKIFSSGKTGRSTVSSAGAAKEYSGLSTSYGIGDSE